MAPWAASSSTLASKRRSTFTRPAACIGTLSASSALQLRRDQWQEQEPTVGRNGKLSTPNWCARSASGARTADTSHAHTVLSWLSLARWPSGRTASERVSRRDESLAPRLQWQLKGRQVPRRRHEGIIACSSAKQRRQLAFRSTKCCVEAVGARSVGLPALGKQLCNYAHRRVYARHVGRVALEMRATASDEPASPHGGSGDILRRRMSHRHARCTYKLVQRAAEHTHNEATDKLLCETTTFDARNLKATPRVRDLTPRGAPDAVAT